MDSLTLKIHSFMNQVGSPIPAREVKSGKALEMVRFFEEEYNLRMMSLLENEWVEEQVERDLSYGEFSQLRNHVPAERRSDFDAVVSSVL